MTEPDYAALGLKCGLEIHQQIDSHKLFCSCPSHIRDDTPSKVVHRKLRAAAGETGNVDTAAAGEMKKDVYYLYEAYNDTTCLVELDEEPPHGVNKNALEIVLRASKMMHARILDTLQVMRKTVVDGSNTSGFQRTALVALGGHVPTSLGNVNIQTICIEEDAAKIVERTGEYTRYNLSKLGIPLVEVATDPDIKTPEHARETAAYIGMVLRSTKGVKRGIGTIRQDLNVSIKGGERIEIKGAQELDLIPLWVKNEALRQSGLLEIKQTLPKTLDFPLKIVDVTDIVSSCESPMIKKVLQSKGKILGMRLEHFAGLLGRELQTGRRLGSELSDYAKVHGGVGGIIHSDEKVEKYGMDANHVTQLKNTLGCKEKDAFVLVCAEEKKGRKALEAAYGRALMCTTGVPKEVRQPLPDGTTAYMRPIPTADRMYPETDCRSITLHASKVEPYPLIEEAKKQFKKRHAISEDQVNALFHDQRDALFEECVHACANLKEGFIAEVLISVETELQRKERLDTSKITSAHYKEVLAALNEGKVSKESLPEMFTSIVKSGHFDISKFGSMDADAVRMIIKRIAEESKGAPFNVLMGKVMGVLRGKADGKLISEIVKEFAS